MLKLVSDENVDGRIIAGIRQQLPGVDLVRIQDFLPQGTSDPVVLAWAADQNRISITNDRNTMIDFANARIANQQFMPGLICTIRHQSIGDCIADIVLITQCVSPEEFLMRNIIYLPLSG
jgi:hypothetical protein